MRPFRFGLSSSPPSSRAAWQQRAKQVEDLGYSTLLVADHLGMASALAPLVSAADVTTNVRLGPLVLNNDFHHPLRLAQDAATVDLLTDGRLELGLGSGWAETEYQLMGLSYERPPARAQQLARSLRIMKDAWAGEPALTLGEQTGPAVLAPTQKPHPPILIGGWGDAVLTLAAQEADIVGLTGLTWGSGRLHPTGAAMEAFEERVAFVKGIAGDRFDDLELNVLVQIVVVDGDTEAVIADLATRFGVAPSALRGSPLLLIGSEAELIDKLLALRERLGLSYFVVFDAALESFAPIVAGLAGR